VTVEKKKLPTEPESGRADICLDWLMVGRTEKRGEQAPKHQVMTTIMSAMWSHALPAGVLQSSSMLTDTCA